MYDLWGLSRRLEKHSRALVIVGLILAAGSNYLHNTLEEETARKGELVAAIEKYERLTSLYTLASEEDRNTILVITAQRGSNTEKLINALPTLDRSRHELLAALGGLQDLANHVDGVEAKKRRVREIIGKGLRVQIVYESLVKRLAGDFTKLPTDEAQASDVSLLASSYYEIYSTLATEYPQLEQIILQQADKQNASQKSAGHTNLIVSRILTWVGFVVALGAALKPSARSSPSPSN